MNYKIIKRIADLSKYQESYDTLISSCTDNEYYYYQYNNLLCMAEFLEKRVSISIILIFHGEVIVAIAPLQIRKRHIIYFGNRILQFLGSSNHPLGSKYGNIIYACEVDKLKVDETILSALYSPLMPSWDEILFDNIKQDAFPPLFDYFNYRYESVPSCYRTPTEYDHEEFLYKYLKRKSRYKLNRSKRDLINDFRSIEFLRFDKFDDDVFNEIETLHSERQRFKRENSGFKHYHSLFDNPIERNAILNLTKWLSINNKLSLYLLKADGKIISFLYCVDVNSLSNVILMAFDNQYEKYTPSKLLALYAFDNQYKRKNLTEMDFLEDHNLFKKQLCPIEIKRFSLNAANPKSLSSRLKHKYITAVKNYIIN